MFTQETIIRTGTLGKKISCYVGDSACRWLIIKNVKMFYVKYESSSHVSRPRQLNNVSVSFFLLLFRTFIKKKTVTEDV